MTRVTKISLLAGAALAAASLLVSQSGIRERVGFLPDGGFLLNSGWKIKPVGTQIPVDTFPMAQTITPDGKLLLVLNGGYNPPSISVIDIATAKELSRARVPDGWLGLTLNKAGDRVYVGGGSKAAIYEFALANGALTPSRIFPIVQEKDRKKEDFIGDVQFSPDGRLLYAADLYRDSVVVVNPQSGLVISRVKTGRRPYRILFHKSGKSFYVSSWSDGSIGQYDTASGSQMGVTRVGPHATDMVWRDGGVEDQPAVKARMFVSASNTNSVFVLGATETGELSRLETINLALSPLQPVGMTPEGMGLSSDGDRLLVACADANAVAVIDLKEDRSRILGFVPTGWYPTAAFGLPGGRMGVLNSRGLQSYPNVKGPSPTAEVVMTQQGTRSDEYVGRMQTGTVQFVDGLDEARLLGLTQDVIGNSPYRDEKVNDPGIPANNAVRARGPIKHVIYIVKENRTFDQVLGDMKPGNGDPSLVLFGEKATPNLHKIAKDFVLLDNFYVNSDVSADGHNWATAAIAPDYVQKLWQNSYANRRTAGDYEGQEPANSPPAGYIWTNAAQAGVSMRNYGYFADNLEAAKPDGTQIDHVHDTVLAKVTDMKYRSWDLDYPDIDRAKAFIDDLQDFEKAGSMPQLLIMRMGNDHTSGTTPGKVAPLSAASDNDQAVGMLVEAVSKSRFWNETAIFIIEDDAQNGPDHVDSHRSPAWVISPWVKRGTVNSTMYNQASVLRTMEIILGMRPMTVFDAGARPMWSVFAETATLAPYTLEAPQTPVNSRNPQHSATAERSSRMNFKEADDIDDDELNAILWTAIKGSGVPPPPPVTSRFSR
jgi:YVTN family beta-propeller protein